MLERAIRIAVFAGLLYLCLNTKICFVGITESLSVVSSQLDELWYEKTHEKRKILNH
jgi:hypothetical protein